MATISEIKPTAFQCENRYKSLLKKCREVNDHNETLGEERRDWKYLDVMSSLLKERRNVHPVAGCSSLELNNNNTTKQ
jgi:hypothetical protein